MHETHEMGPWRHGATGRPRAASTGMGGSSAPGAPPGERARSPEPRAPRRASQGLGRLRMGRPQLHCTHQGPRWGLFLRCVRKAQASEGTPQASLLLLLLPPLLLPRSAHTRRACCCRMRPRTTLASSSEWPHSWAATCTQEQGSPQSTCSEPRHCRSSSESRQPGRPSRPLPRERKVGGGQSGG